MVWGASQRRALSGIQCVSRHSDGREVQPAPLNGSVRSRKPPDAEGAPGDRLSPCNETRIERTGHSVKRAWSSTGRCAPGVAWGGSPPSSPPSYPRSCSTGSPRGYRPSYPRSYPPGHPGSNPRSYPRGNPGSYLRGNPGSNPGGYPGGSPGGGGGGKSGGR